jgi:hypothetical protein
MHSAQRPAGIVALSAFSVFGALMSGIAAFTLLYPRGVLDTLWRVNPDGHESLRKMGAWGIALMLLVCLGCTLTAIGLWRMQTWGHRLAVGGLVVNMIGDIVSAVLRGDARTLIGVPIGLAVLVYLMSGKVRDAFRVRAASS